MSSTIVRATVGSPPNCGSVASLKASRRPQFEASPQAPRPAGAGLALRPAQTASAPLPAFCRTELTRVAHLTGAVLNAVCSAPAVRLPEVGRRMRTRVLMLSPCARAHSRIKWDSVGIRGVLAPSERGMPQAAMRAGRREGDGSEGRPQLSALSAEQDIRTGFHQARTRPSRRRSGLTIEVIEELYNAHFRDHTGRSAGPVPGAGS